MFVVRMRAAGCKRRKLLFGGAAIAVMGGAAAACRRLEPPMPARSERDATLAELAREQSRARSGVRRRVGEPSDRAFGHPEAALASIAAAALRLYLGSGDFTALVSAALTIRDAKLGEPNDADAPSWPELLAEATRRKDDHDVKLVDACHDENEARATPGYRAAAALRLGPSRAP